jgi:hypothetical protein
MRGLGIEDPNRQFYFGCFILDDLCFIFEQWVDTISTTDWEEVTTNE